MGGYSPTNDSPEPKQENTNAEAAPIYPKKGATASPVDVEASSDREAMSETGIFTLSGKEAVNRRYVGNYGASIQAHADPQGQMSFSYEHDGALRVALVFRQRTLRYRTRYS